MRSKSIIFLSLIIALLVGIVFLWQTNKTPHPAVVLPTPTTIPGWKTFANKELQVSYPSDWVIVPKNYAYNDYVVGFESSDYKQSIVGYPEKGYMVLLYITPHQPTPTPDNFPNAPKFTAWTKQTMWLGQKATLEKLIYDQNDLALSTTAKNKDYRIELTSNNKTKAEEYMNLFLQVANTVKLK